MKRIINLFGGPGAGKSTTAAGVFSLLKLDGVNCELVTEYAKDLVWEDRHKTLENQFYVSAKQHNRLWRIPETVDIVITDSPILLGILYSNDKLFKSMLIKKFSEFNNLNFFLNRVKSFNEIGRLQKEEEANKFCASTVNLLDDNNIPYITTDGNAFGISYIYDYIKKNKASSGV